MKRTRIIGFLGLLVAAAPVLGAQQRRPQIREGLWLSAGIGGGAANARCDGCIGSSDFGLSGYLRIGGTPHPDILAGLEGNGWTQTAQGIDETIGFLSAVAYAYPDPESGPWVKAGAGIARFVASNPENTLTSTGFGIIGGLGYDYRVSRNVSLTPYVNYMRQLGARIEINGASVSESINVELLQAGVGLTWH